MNLGFVDLRSDSGAGRVSDNFWPSFTDIMMVVVMIFMIASTVLVLRNWELVDELRATMEAEREAAEMARSMTQTNATLEEQLAQAQQRVADLNLALMEARARNEQLTEARGALQEQVRVLESDKRALSAQLQSETRTRQTAEEALADLRSQFTELRGRYQELGQRLESTREALASAEQVAAQRLEQVNRLQEQRDQERRQRQDLVAQYSDLKTRYDRLVRPARSPEGKYVVEVRYRKVEGEARVGIKEPEHGQFRQVSRQALHERLAQLQEGHPDELYVKIVIPEDSGLSYTEAWRFTKDVLEKYDYYYQ